MKYLYLLTILIFAGCMNPSNKANTKEGHTIYLVRHAEKTDDGTKDPPLTEDGETRAKKLAEKLKDEGIKKIYSTDYNRTRNTAAPLSEKLGIKTSIYDPRDTSFYNLIKKESKSMSLLIVGHSNTTPTLTNQIIGEKKFKQLDESVYDQLFEVSSKDGKFKASVGKMD